MAKGIEELANDLKANEDLRTRLAAAGSDRDKANALLTELGYGVNVDELEEYAAQMSKEEPSDETLRAVAGGGVSTNCDSALICTVVGSGAVCWD